MKKSQTSENKTEEKQQIEEQRNQEILDEINLHKIHMYLLQDLKAHYVNRGFDKIYYECGSTGEGFYYFHYETNEGERLWPFYYLDPAYIKYLESKKLEYLDILEGHQAIYIDNDGNIQTGDAVTLAKQFSKS